MKTVKILLLSTMTLLNYSCAEAKSPKTDTSVKSQTTDDTAYSSSDKKLNEAYNKFNVFQSSVLQQSLKTDQTNWLKFRAKTCGMSSLVQPTSDTQKSCFIVENDKHINQLNARFANLQDLANSYFKIVEQKGNKSTLSSQANCACDKNLPYLDLKNSEFAIVEICRIQQVIVPKKPIEKIIFVDDYIDFQTVNSFGSSYHVIFKPQADNTYLIITDGDWGVIKDLHFPAYVTPLKNKPFNRLTTKDLCEGFNG